MTFVLYLMLTGFGWIRFEAYDDEVMCNKMRDHIVENHSDKFGDGRCFVDYGPIRHIRLHPRSRYQFGQGGEL